MAAERQQGNIAGVYDVAEHMTAAGSLVVASGDGTPVEVPVGTPGQVFTADPTAPAGVAWKTLDPAALNVQNAANLNLFGQGM